MKGGRGFQNSSGTDGVDGRGSFPDLAKAPWVGRSAARGELRHEHLTDVLARVSDAQSDDDLDAHLPDRWKPMGNAVSTARFGAQGRGGSDGYPEDCRQRDVGVLL